MAMAASDNNTRRSDEAERARHVAAGEAAAFATTAGAMLLGLLTGAEAAQHRSETGPQPPAPTTPPAAPPVRPTEAAPTERTPADQGSQHEDQHSSASEQPATDAVPSIHADAAATVQSPDPGAAIGTIPHAEAVAAHASPLSIPVWDFDVPADRAPSAGAAAGLSPAAPSSTDLGASVHQITDTITGIIDTSLATVSQTIAGLSDTVGQLTTSLSDTIGHLTDGLTGAVSGIIGGTPAAATLEPVTELLGTTPLATNLSGTSQHDGSLLDTAGTIPTALLQPLPLQLGFLGQPTMDGHETHDGAFSALGIHHF
jgi:hypothetical protein